MATSSQTNIKNINRNQKRTVFLCVTTVGVLILHAITGWSVATMENSLIKPLEQKKEKTIEIILLSLNETPEPPKSIVTLKPVVNPKSVVKREVIPTDNSVLQKQKQWAVEQTRKAKAKKKVQAEANAQAEANTKAKAKKKIQSEANAQAKAKKKIQSEANAQAEAKKKIQSEANTKTEAKKKTQAEVNAKAKAKKKVQSEENAQAEANKKIQSEANTKTEAKKKTQAEVNAKAEAKKKAQPEASAKAEAKKKAQAEAKKKTQAEATAKAEAKKKTQAEVTAKAEAKKKGQAEATVQAEATEQGKTTNVNLNMLSNPGWKKKPIFSAKYVKGKSAKTINVRFRFSVDKQGNVTNVEITKPSGNRKINRDLKRQAKVGKFNPFKNKSGQPVSGKFNLTIDVNLQ